MPKTLVVFPGWSLGESSYKKLVSNLSGWNIVFVPYVKIASRKSLHDISDEVSALLKRHPKAFVLGHSLGGILAMDFAARYPEKVSRLFLVNSVGNISDLPLHRLFCGFAKNNLAYAKLAFWEQMRSFGRVVSNLRTQIKLARHAARYDSSEVAGKVKVPTTLLWGTEDHLVSMEAGERLHKLISDSSLCVLKGEGHDWIVHKPEYLIGACELSKISCILHTNS
ncbi:MAG: alpha/beta hydrolase [Candidatus Blackburnbacteria bacterium]|nr:alpha/beta hydrolase [Candidatus Blackburnbacteria bacterium]